MPLLLLQLLRLLLQLLLQLQSRRASIQPGGRLYWPWASLKGLIATLLHNQRHCANGNAVMHHMLLLLLLLLKQLLLLQW